MMQQAAWEREYRKPQLVSGTSVPSEDVKRFSKFLRKELKKDDHDLGGLSVLDLGSGLGKHAEFFAERGAMVTGFEISDTAIAVARGRAREASLSIEYKKQDIGAPYPLADASIDIVLDVMSSNSLDEAGRAVYLSEVARVLKPGGYFFIKALCKDGDKNAQALLKEHPGAEYDTYVMQELGLTERVWSREDFISYYTPQFALIELSKKTAYPSVNGRLFKRNYWIAYLQKSKDI